MKRVLLRPQAVKDLEAMQGKNRRLVEDAIEQFAETGVGDIKKLRGKGNQFRLRAGDWRIRFVLEAPDVMRLLHIRHRREAYRD